TRPLVARPMLNCTSAQSRLVVHMRDSRGIQMCGLCYSRNGAVLVNGRIASVCCAEQLVVVSDGCGIPKTTSGPKFTRSIRDGGSMWMPVRRPGIIHDSTLKVCICQLSENKKSARERADRRRFPGWKR